MRTGKVYKKPAGKHTYAVYATVNGKRGRHTYYLTKELAEKMYDVFTSETSKRLGLMKNVKIVNHKPKV